MIRRLSIRSKLTLLLLLSGLTGALTVGAISFVNADRALRNATWDQLVAMRETKKDCLLRLFDEQLDAFQLFSGDAQLVLALAAFRSGFDAKGAELTTDDEKRLVEYYQTEFLPELPPDTTNRALDDYLPTTRGGARLQVDYLVDNPHPAGERAKLESRASSMFATTGVDPYDAAHRIYHAWLNRATTALKLYDVLLIDAVTADIVYTDQKEPDFGTNLENGPYRTTGLADAFRRARDGKLGDHGIVVTDFERYPASLGAPAAFLAAPITRDGRIVGVVAGQLSIDAIDDAINSGGRWQAEGLGNTGEVYLVGPDRTARSDSRLLLEDRDAYLASLRSSGAPAEAIDAVEHFGHSVLNQSFPTDAVTEALQGIEGTATGPDYRGVEVMTASAPIEIGGLHWAVIAEKDVSEALGPLFDLRRQILLAAAALTVILTAFALWAARVFLDPIARLEAGVQRLQEGALDVEVDASGSDEFAALGHAFNDMVAEIASRNRTIELKTADYENLLHNVLPEVVADRVRAGELLVADTFDNVSILYASISGLSELMDGLSATDTLRLLNELIDGFDDAAERHGVEKIKTLGDAYLAVCGLSTPRLDHRQRVRTFADDMVGVLNRFNEAKRMHLNLRIGLAAGEVDAGIVGRRRFVYEILGDCVVEARELAYSGERTGIHLSAAFAAALTPATGGITSATGTTGDTTEAV